MEIKYIIPQYDEFINLLNNFNFNQEEITDQKQFVSKYSTMDWDTYLLKVHYLLANSLNIDTFTAEFEKMNGHLGSKSYTIPNLMFKHFRPKTIDELQLLNDLLDKLDAEQKIKYNAFIDKLLILFTTTIIENLSDSSVNLQKFSGNILDINTQLADINPSTGSRLKKIHDVSEAICLPNLRTILQQQNHPFYYFRNKMNILEQLHDELVEIDYISINENFVKLFEREFAFLEYTPIECHKEFTQVQSLYLLYRLNDCDLLFNDLPLSKVAHRLFKYHKNVDENSLSTNFRKASLNFDNQSYLDKKMYKLITILSRLGIK